MLSITFSWTVGIIYIMSCIHLWKVPTLSASSGMPVFLRRLPFLFWFLTRLLPSGGRSLSLQEVARQTKPLGIWGPQQDLCCPVLSTHRVTRVFPFNCLWVFGGGKKMGNCAGICYKFWVQPQEALWGTPLILILTDQKTAKYSVKVIWLVSGKAKIWTKFSWLWSFFELCVLSIDYTDSNVCWSERERKLLMLLITGGFPKFQTEINCVINKIR